MPLPIHITPVVYNQFMLDLSLLLDEQITNNPSEYAYLITPGFGLTPRMRVNMYESINTFIRDLLNNEHPIILKKLVQTIMESLNASVLALFSIRDSNSFSPYEIKNYLYRQLEHLINLDGSSILSDYIIIDHENTLEHEAEESDQN